MAGAEGFEPPTTGFGDQRSGQTELRSYYGTPGGTRTPDARLRTPPLYPPELQGQDYTSTSIQCPFDLEMLNPTSSSVNPRNSNIL